MDMGTDTSSTVAQSTPLSNLAGQDPTASWHEKLNDGTAVLIRSIGKDDVILERAFIDGLSAQTREYRFLGQVNASAELVRRLTDIDRERDAAFIALHQGAAATVEIGVGRFCMTADTSTCECAIAVSDQWQHKGLGTLLMGHLIDIARQRGIKRMVSIDMADNGGMRHLAKSLGFERKTEDGSHGEVVHTLYL